MNQAIMSYLLLLAGLFLTIGCDPASGSGNPKEAVHQHEHEGEEAEEGGEMEVAITPEQAEAIGLQLGALEYKDLQSKIPVTGRLELFPQNRALVGTLMPGRVESIRVIEGDRVTKGSVLATLTHPDYISLQQELQELVSQRSYLLLEKERKQKLFEENVTSGREYQQARAAYLSNEAAIKGLREKLRLLGLDPDAVEQGKMFPFVPVTAPISGFVHKVMTNIGELVAPNDPLFEITNNDHIHVDLRVFEKDIYKVKKGQKVLFTVANHPDKVLEATVLSIGKAFEDDLKSVHVHAELDNPGLELLPGMYVEGRILEESRPVPVLPEEAVVREAESSFVFIAVEESAGQTEESHDEEGHEEGHEAKKLKFRKVPVVTGKADLGYVEIKLLDSLPPDTRFVIRGGYMLSSELIKGELEHEH